jgi:nicotinate-nucleotide pyrophosphorylase (carboxylating)
MTAVRDVVARALAEDLEPLGDVTAALLPDQESRAAVVPRAAGVLAGRPAAEEVFRSVDPSVVLVWRADDGDALTAGEAVAELTGPLASILTAERTALNLLCHLSGIATATRRWVDACAGRLTVWDTRKTTPGLRALEKAAVRAGGGANHRGNLSEWVLLKDNHLAALGITEAVRRARERWPGRTVQVEADRFEQLVEAIEADADLVLLDNMTPDEVRACVAARGDSRRPLLEISGGVTFESLPAYVDTGADLVSAGALTASAPALDLGLDVDA